MNTIAVIGAGTMGSGIAHVFAQKGFQVNLIDVSKSSLAKGVATITKNLDRMLAKERITAQEKQETLSRINTFTDTSICLLYTSPSPRDKRQSRMPSSA